MAGTDLAFNVLWKDSGAQRGMVGLGEAADTTGQKVDRLEGKTRRMGAGFAKFGRSLEKDVGVRVDKLGGGFSLLSQFIGGPLGAALTGAAFAMDTVSTALGIVSVANIKAAGRWVVHKTAMVAATIASKAAAIAMRAAGIAMMIATGPIGLVVVGILALAAGLVFAYKKSETFRNVVKGVLKVVALGFLFLVSTALKAIRFIVNAYLSFVSVMVNGAAKAFGWVPKLGPKLRAAADGFNKFKDKTIGALDKTIDKVDRLRDRIAGIKSKKITFDVRVTGAVGTALALSSGGSAAGRASSFDRGGTLRPGLNLVHNGTGRPERLVPENGNGGGLHVHIHGAVGDPAAVARMVHAALIDLQGRGFKLGFTS